MGEVLIEFDSGIGATDRWIAVDVAMALDKRTPKVAARFEVSLSVLSDSDCHLDQAAKRIRVNRLAIALTESDPGIKYAAKWQPKPIEPSC